jgi:hypothetical protein
MANTTAHSAAAHGLTMRLYTAALLSIVVICLLLAIVAHEGSALLDLCCR